MYDVTGTGNSVDTSHPQVRQLVMDSLRYWVEEMGVDGFRFDLAVTLVRNERHEVDIPDHPFLAEVAADPVLGRVKLISEPWDVGPFGYQVGNFGPPWSEWNGKFRDSVRDVWRNTSDGVKDLAYRLSGSSDLYGDDGRYPYASINFVTAHDGFTIRDLVSYDHKHNEANHEDNRDGTDDNRSWNCGVEGETDDAGVIALRKRQMANLMSTLVLSTGVPMITAGDECGRTQDGNNNAYCQDSEISWFDWSLPSTWSDHLELTKKLLALRAAHPALRQWHYFSGQPVVSGGRKDLSWIAPHGGEMTDADWFDGNLRTIGMFLRGDALRATDAEGNALTDSSFLLALNATAETPDGRRTGRVLGTGVRSGPGHQQQHGDRGRGRCNGATRPTLSGPAARALRSLTFRLYIRRSPAVHVWGDRCFYCAVEVWSGRRPLARCTRRSCAGARPSGPVRGWRSNAGWTAWRTSTYRRGRTRSTGLRRTRWRSTPTGPLWVVLGDSTAQGLGASSPLHGYVGQVLNALRRTGTPWRVLNLSRSGAQTRHVLDDQLPLLDGLSPHWSPAASATTTSSLRRQSVSATASAR